MTIRISDVARQNALLLPELMALLQEVVLSGQYIKGEYLDRLEMEMAYYHGVKHCIGVGSGTDALYLVLKSAEIGLGDEVIVPAMTFVATAEAVALTGATPVFVDITDDGRDSLDPNRIRAKITGKTKAIIPVHLHGYPCDMGRIMVIASELKLIVIEDCAQATGAIYNQRVKVGAIGNAGCFSFFPTKNLGCIGDGGCILTDDDALAAEIRARREHGGAKNDPMFVGNNSRLDGLQAAFLSLKLQMLDQWNTVRQVLAQRYDKMLRENLAQSGVLHLVQLPPISDDCVYHHYALRVLNPFPTKLYSYRDHMIARLEKQGIEAISYYPRSIPMMLPYFGNLAEWENSEANHQARTGLALPIFPELTEAEQAKVCRVFVSELKDLHSVSVNR